MPNTDIPYLDHDGLMYYHQHAKAHYFATKEELNGKADADTAYTIIHDTNVHYSECYAKVKYMHDAYNK